MPFNDNHLIFDEITNQYRLTPQAILDNFGIDLENEAKGTSYGNVAVEAILKTISNHVYNFIHKHNVNNTFQNLLISQTEEGRTIVKRAMLEQFAYVRTVGDLSRSPDINKRKLWFDKNAEMILFEPIILNNRKYCLLYTGNY